jgi:hypothetical protein
MPSTFLCPALSPWSRGFRSPVTLAVARASPGAAVDGRRVGSQPLCPAGHIQRPAMLPACWGPTPSFRSAIPSCPAMFRRASGLMPAKRRWRRGPESAGPSEFPRFRFRPRLQALRGDLQAKRMPFRLPGLAFRRWLAGVSSPRPAVLTTHRLATASVRGGGFSPPAAGRSQEPSHPPRPPTLNRAGAGKSFA